MTRIGAFLCWVFLFGFCTVASAQVVSVRAGEHADFSRLVFSFPAGRTWSMQPVDDGFLLTFDLVDIGLRDLGVFELIPRTRITGLIADRENSTILILTGCNCSANAFLDVPGKLVVDVSDDPIFALIDGAEFTQDSASTTGDSVSPRDRLPDLLPPSTFFAIPEPDAGSRVEAVKPSVVAVDPPQPAELQQRDPPADEISPPPPETDASRVVPETTDRPIGNLSDQRLNQTRDLVLKELARATAQGLLDANPDLQRVDDNQDISLEAAEAPPEGIQPLRSLNLDEIDAFLAALPNARAETAIDRGVRTEIQPRPLNAEGIRCIENDDLDIASWTGEGTIYSQISQYRLALVEEFDRENRNAAMGLARSYVYLSFGAEALVALNMIPLTGKDADILRAMAEIVDLGFAENPGPFATQLSCDTAAAFWAALSLPKFQPGMAIDRKAILLTFSGLPLHLRRHLGPTLALRFLEIGDRDTSFALRDAIDRAQGEHGEGFELLRANIDRDLGRTISAERRFDQIAALDGSLAPTALIERIEMAIETEGALPKGAVESVAALAFEYRGTEEGARLAQSYVLANIVENRFDEALSSLLRIETGDASEADIFPELWSQLALGMARTEDDVVFLSAYYKHRETLSHRQVSQGARERLADRLVKLGFGREAVDEMRRHAAPTSGAGELLLARALIFADQNLEARSVLSGVDSEESRALLAGIAEQEKDYGEAAQIYRTLSDPDRQVASAWRAGDWQEVAKIADGTRKSAAELMTVPDTLALSRRDAPPEEPANAGETPNGTIANNENRLAHSQWVRSTLRDLLEN